MKPIIEMTAQEDAQPALLNKAMLVPTNECMLS